jgi:hypothetical protein
MATRKHSSGSTESTGEPQSAFDGIDPRSVLALPFVADVPDPGKPGRTTRQFWVVPSGATVDYGEACRIGARWAAEYVAWEAAHGMSFLFTIVQAMAESKSMPVCGARGFAVGFLDALRELAIVGSGAYGGADRYGDWKEQQYRERRAAGNERERAEIAERVSRMNAGRHAKRAKRDPNYQRFKATLLRGSRP